MTDFLIIGQGLAGTTLAWQLVERGVSFKIVDEGLPVTSSKAAAGVVNPITGKYFAKSWRIDESWPVAREFYRSIEARTGERFFFEMPVLRLLTSDAERKQWEKKKGREDLANFLAQPQPKPLGDNEYFCVDGGGFETRNSGYLDVRAFLDASRKEFEKTGCFVEAAVSDEEIHAEPLRWRDQGFRKGIVFCQGFKAAGHGFFDWIPFKSAKGEILTLRSTASLPMDRIINGGGGWLLPDQNAPGIFRAGSTYSWDPLDSEVTEEGRTEILTKLQKICRAKFEVIGQEAAVRPIIRASKALIGQHPAYPQLAYFNGLGSKGVLNAPFFAKQLVAQLLDGVPVDEIVDLCKNEL